MEEERKKEKERKKERKKEIERRDRGRQEMLSLQGSDEKERRNFFAMKFLSFRKSKREREKDEVDCFVQSKVVLRRSSIA